MRRRVSGPCPVPDRDGSASGRASSTREALPLQQRPSCRRTEERTVEVVIERWTYDFGSNRLVHYLRFEEDELVDVKVGGYGDKPPAG